MHKSGWAFAVAALAAGVAIAGGAASAHDEAVASAAYVAAADAAAVTADQAAVFIKSPADVERGRQLFAGTCGAYCHRMTNTPGSDAPFLFGCSWIFGGSDQQIFHTITHGAPGTRMVSFEGAIPDADIWRIIAYLKSASQCKK